jgi:outer membrane protein TolC
MIPRASAFLVVRRSILGLALGLAAAGGLRGQEQAARGTMPEDYLPDLKALLATALKQSPTAIAQQISIAQNEASVIQADSSMIPQVSGSASYQQNSERISETGIQGQTSNSHGLFYNANVSEPLFAWGALFNQSRIARIGVAIARDQFDEAYRSLAEQIREGYLGLIVGKINLRNARYQEAQAEQALKVAQVQLKEGAIASSSISGPELAAREARLAADTTAEAYLHGLRTLAMLAGVPDLPDAAIPLDFPKPVYSEPEAQALVADFLRTDAKDTFQAKMDQLAVDRDKLNYRIARTGLLPKLYANAGIDLFNQSSLSSGNTSVSQVAILEESYGLSVNWNIFDGFRTRGAMRSALANQRADERTLATYEDTTVEQAEDLERQVNFAARTMEIAEIRDQFAATALHDTRAEFKFGSVPQSAIDQSTADDYAAVYALAASRRDYFSRWCEFVSLVGADPLMNDLPFRHDRFTH